MTAVQLVDAARAAERSDEWRDARRAGIGASEIAAVLGISPWTSPFALYWQKRQGWADVDSPEKRRGRRMEQVVAEEWEDANPGHVLMPAGLYRHPQHEWMLATPDRLLYDVDGPLPGDPAYGPPVGLWECKTSATRDGWGDDGTDEVPAHYHAQCQWQSAVFGGIPVRLAVMFLPSWEMRTYHIEHDPHDLEVMLTAGRDLMRRLREDDPPEPDWTPASTRALKRLHGSVEDRDVEIPEALVLRYTNARHYAAAAEQDKAAVENEIRAKIGDARRAVCGGVPVATRVVYQTSRIDIKALRADQPDIARKYAVTSIVDQLRAATRKEK